MIIKQRRQKVIMKIHVFNAQPWGEKTTKHGESNKKKIITKKETTRNTLYVDFSTSNAIST